jgi:hypothetical protein
VKAERPDSFLAAPAAEPPPKPAPVAATNVAPVPVAPRAAASPPPAPKPVQLDPTEFKNDPLIKKALEVFKGTIVEVRA